MKKSIFIFFLLLLFFMILAYVSSQGFCDADQCRVLEFTPEKAFDGKRLINHVIRIVEVLTMSFCDNMCYVEPDCVSINVHKQVSGHGGYKCELNNVTHERHEHDLEKKDDYFYHAAESACVDNPCDNNSTCQSGFTNKGYRCLCTTGFKGPRCNKDIDECATGKMNCSADAVCNNAKGSYNCTCKQGYYGDGNICRLDINECIEGTSDCSADAVCNNIQGSYNCTCKPGYSGDGRTCEDIDECATGKQNCSADAVCNNTKGSYNCICKQGYYGDGNICRSDINECIEGTSDCSADAVCNNIKGSYNCTCKPGYSGDGRTCEDIDECATGKQNCSADAVCNNTKGSYNCTCKQGYYGDGNICRSASTCKEIFERNVSKKSGEVTLHLDSKPVSVFCHMGDFGCGNGGWTPIMKINGSKRTFRYHSHFWNDKETYQDAAGKNGFDLQETKLPTYWKTPFSKICLGMKIGQQLRFIFINKTAESLYSLIADGKYRATSLGRDTWKKVVGSQASLQQNCNKEGFNVKGGPSEARIGVIANQENDCFTCDSRIGFGIGGDNSCGNVATHKPDNGNKHIRAMGYILVH
ncbi:fibulin-2-like [Pocillopora verrucosa]|uniref:fibulin-2-like n=1 Tax=Pocillopora verrucosa TaxID=203993 RepID=UPI00333EB148